MFAACSSFDRALRVAFIAPYPAASALPPVCIKPEHRVEHPATWIRTLAEALSRLPGIELRVLSDSRAVDRTRQVIVRGVDYTFLSKKEPIRSDPYHGFWPGYFRARKALADFDPELVVGFGIESGCAGIATRFRCPRAVFIQGIIEKVAPFSMQHPFRLRAMLREERRVLRSVEGFIAETQFAADWVAARAPRARIIQIPHALDTTLLSIRPTHEKPAIVCIGSLTRIKDPETLLRAFAQCRVKEKRLLFVGAGPLRSSLETLADQLGVSPRVEFLGMISRDRLREVLTDARCVALASRMDTSPNAVTEAHTAGLPVVATLVGGIPEMVEDGRDGFLVPAGDAAAMAARLDWFLANPALARAFGEAGRQKVRTLNDPDRIARSHLDFYRSLVSR